MNIILLKKRGKKVKGGPMYETHNAARGLETELVNKRSEIQVVVEIEATWIKAVHIDVIHPLCLAE